MLDRPTGSNALSALRDIARSLSTAIDLDTNLNLIVNKTTEVMAVDSCTLYLLEKDNVTLRLKATTGLRAQIQGHATLRIGEGMTGAAVTENRPIHAAIARQHPKFKYLDRVSEDELTSLLAIPLLIRNQPIGALNVQTIEGHDYTVSEIELLSLIGELAAGALSKAQVYDAQRLRLEELQTLATVSEVVTAPTMFDDMLDIVTDMAARTMDAAVCSLFLLNETGEKLELRSAKRVETPYAARNPLAKGEGIIGRVAQSGERAYVADISADSRFANPQLAAEEGLVSMLAVPLSVRDKVIGVVACYTNELREFSENQISLFTTLANQTALAIENARLATHAAVVREMHHRIKNNLQTVAMLMQLQIPDAARLDTREVLETNIHRIRSIATVHEVLSEKGFHLVDVKDVLTRIARATVQAVNAPNRAIMIDVLGESLSLNSQAATALALIVNELVQNAVEHAFVGRTQGIIEVTIGRSPTNLHVWVCDDGIGLPENLEHGLGLEIAETLMLDDLDGTMNFYSHAHGTEVALTMPRKS